MKEYVDNDTEEELTASLTLMEIARIITYLRAIGLTEKRSMTVSFISEPA